MTITVAIVGSGPSAFYTAGALIKSDMAIQIDMIERLPTPFGLVRGGVAPDHQSTKRVAMAYERTALSEYFSFYGNVSVGRDITLAELRSCYDAVVLAIGMPTDQPLKIPGADKKNVIGAAAFVGWYNAIPEFTQLEPNLNTNTISVIGNGNVALDIARVLVKTETEMSTSDIACHAAAAIRLAPVKNVHIFGRRGPVECKFTNVELREMGHLEDCTPVVDVAQLPSKLPDGLSDRDRRLKEKNLSSFREFSSSSFNPKSKRVHFHFFANPVSILGEDTAEGLKLEKTQVVGGVARGSGKFFEIACGLVIHAIGYRADPIDGVKFNTDTGTIGDSEGRVAAGLYSVGWIRRGPTGVIGTNKHDGDAIAKQIRADLITGRKPGRRALEKILKNNGTRWVTYSNWKQIEAAEVGAAISGAPRQKFVSVQDMLRILD